ncbi:LSG1, partial [Symbiodinium microadriaticum]
MEIGLAAFHIDENAYDLLREAFIDKTGVNPVKAPEADPDPAPAEVEDNLIEPGTRVVVNRFEASEARCTNLAEDLCAEMADLAERDEAKTAASARARAPAGGYAPATWTRMSETRHSQAIPAAAGAGPEDLAIPEGSIMLGLVGHPNVGKSSMVNSLMGGKATPGHTKTLQTLKLDDKTCLLGPGPESISAICLALVLSLPTQWPFMPYEVYATNAALLFILMIGSYIGFFHLYLHARANDMHEQGEQCCALCKVSPGGGDSPGVVFPRLEVPREAQIVGMLMPLAQVREPFSAIR